MTEPPAPTVGGVLTRGLDAVARNPVETLVPALLFGALPASLVTYAHDTLMMDVVAESGELRGELALWFAVHVLGSVTNLLAQGAVTCAVLAHRRDARATLWETTRPALRQLPALLTVGLVVGIATLLAGLLMIVPGLLLFALWSLAGPILVEERRSVLGSLRRSAILWRSAPGLTLGLNFMLVFGYLLFSVLLVVGGVLLWQGADALDAETSPPLPISFHLASVLLIALASAAWATVVAQLYGELRDRVDGHPSDRLAAIFA